MTDTVFTSVAHSIKLFIKDEIRRFTFVGTSFQQLCAEIQPLICNGEFALRYEDEEGDWVTIKSDAELNYALSMAGNRPLKLRAVEKFAIPVSSPVVAPHFGSLIPSPVVAALGKPWKEMKKEAKIYKKQFKEEKKAAKYEAKAAKIEAKIEAKMAKEGFSPKTLFVARFVKHVTVDDGSEFCASTPFVKTWRFRNEGTVPWPEKSVLLCVGKKADQIGAETSSVILSRYVLPGEEIDVSVNMTSPAAGGSYTGFWRLADPSGRKFGPRVRVQIKVIDSSSSSSSDEGASSWGEMLTQLEAMGFSNKALNVKLLVKTHGNLDKVIRKLLKREEKKSGYCKKIAAM